jgi:hypothetical protein
VEGEMIVKWIWLSSEFFTLYGELPTHSSDAELQFSSTRYHCCRMSLASWIRKARDFSDYLNS